MASRGSLIQEAAGGETATAVTPSLTWPLRIGVAAVRLQHLFLSPLVILAIPAAALSGQNLSITVVVTLVGLLGTMRGRQILATTASFSLLTLLIWGKAAASILKTASPDTALLLVEFTAVLVFMEAASAVISFSEDYSMLKVREDEFSKVLRARLQSWLRNQLLNQGKLASVALGMSIVLLPVAGLTSISSNQLVFTATLALLAIVILLFLVTHRREPEAG